MVHIVNLREFRARSVHYAELANKGDTVLVMKKSKPLFKVLPPTDEDWEEVIDFTKIRKGGINVRELLSRL